MQFAFKNRYIRYIRIISMSEVYRYRPQEVAEDLAELLEVFYSKHGGAVLCVFVGGGSVAGRGRGLILAGESYGGHFVPALGHLLLARGLRPRGVLIGDGLTDPASQVLSKPGEAYALGLLDGHQRGKALAMAREAAQAATEGRLREAAESRAEMVAYVRNVSRINPYDVRTTVQYDWSVLQRFFALKKTKEVPFDPACHRFCTCFHIKIDVSSGKRHANAI